MKFSSFLKARWKRFLFPVLSPVVVFICSYFVTNIGWRAAPMALIVMAFMFGLQTVMLYNQWYVMSRIDESFKRANDAFDKVINK